MRQVFYANAPKSFVKALIEEARLFVGLFQISALSVRRSVGFVVTEPSINKLNLLNNKFMSC